MIESPSSEQLAELLETTAQPCISIYLPMEAHGADVRKNPIRFKNAISDAEAQLEGLGFRAQEREAVLEPLRELHDVRPFWQHQERGLAVFRTPERLQTYRTASALPELVLVAERFHLKPLLGLAHADGRFHLLCLSMNDVQFYEGSRAELHRIELEDTPTSMAEALRYDVPEKSLQFHSKTPPAEKQPPQSGQRPAVFHGHGAAADDLEQKKDMIRFLRKVDDGVAQALAGQEIPLIIAGVEYELALYREVNSYPHLMQEGLIGNMENVPQDELHERAWELIRPHFDQARRDRMERYHDLSETDRVLTDLRAIVPAAKDGRIDTLFVLHEERWGRFDEDASVVDLHDRRHPGDVDLHDTAAVWTARNGGVVHVEHREAPGWETLPAAILRY